MAKQYILCVDDEKTVLSSLKQQLNNGLGGDFIYELAESGEEGLEIVQDILKAGHHLPVVISDQLMPGMKGDQFLVKVNQLNPRTRKILLTGQASAQAVGNAVNLAELYRFMSKPWNHEDLLKTVREASKSFFQDHTLDAKLKLLTQINAYGRLLAEDTHLKGWSESLLNTLLVDVDASRGLMAIKLNGKEGSKTEYLEAYRQNGHVLVKKRDAKYLTENFPLGIITSVLTSGKKIHLGSALNNEEHGKDPYIQQKRVQSLYCAPISDKTTTVGAIYLEQSDKANRFTDERAELLDAVTSQSALALKHILLHEELEQKVREGTRDIQEEHGSMRDSIFYASRIQQTMLTQPEIIREVFPHSFLYFKPKDIVSGDFYWFDVVDDVAFVCVADCTGHGVPGAFLTMLGMNLLDRIIRDQKVRKPLEILERLHVSYRKQLKQDTGSALLDGMEISICAIDLRTQSIQVGGAHRPVYAVANGQLSKIMTSRKAVGGKEGPSEGVKLEESFTEEYLHATPGQTIYLFTDGIVDQFSEDNKKKFSSKRLEELITASHHLPMSDQAKAIESRLKLWQGKTHQTDDILMIGIRF